MEQTVLLALLATLFTWAMTALGAAVVLFLPKKKLPLDSLLGFAAGVMLAASFWSLLLPAQELADGGPVPGWIVVTAGFLAGALLLWGVDRLPVIQARHGDHRRNTMMLLSITAHNIPEGLAVGVAFGALHSMQDTLALMGAVSVAVGIGLQNFPEGAAVALPLRAQGMSRRRSFFLGQASGAVEPLAGVLGAALVGAMEPALPWCLALAAGAMVWVTVKELIPQGASAVGAALGFAAMTALDVMLG